MDSHGSVEKEMKQSILLPHEIVGSFHSSGKLDLMTGNQASNIVPLASYKNSSPLHNCRPCLTTGSRSEAQPGSKTILFWGTLGWDLCP